MEEALFDTADRPGTPTSRRSLSPSGSSTSPPATKPPPQLDTLLEALISALDQYKPKPKLPIFNLPGPAANGIQPWAGKVVLDPVAHEFARAEGIDPIKARIGRQNKERGWTNQHNWELSNGASSFESLTRRSPWLYCTR